MWRVRLDVLFSEGLSMIMHSRVKRVGVSFSLEVTILTLNG